MSVDKCLVRVALLSAWERNHGYDERAHNTEPYLLSGRYKTQEIYLVYHFCPALWPTAWVAPTRGWETPTIKISFLRNYGLAMQF